MNVFCRLFLSWISLSDRRSGKPLNNLEGKKYWEILRKSNKSVIEKINETEDEMKDYREYIESWVHEIKLPITALELMVQKEEPKKKNSLMEELERIDNYVEHPRKVLISCDCSQTR